MVVQIHIREGPGDILVFLTGEEEIEDACKKITEALAQADDQVCLILAVTSPGTATAVPKGTMSGHFLPRLGNLSSRSWPGDQLVQLSKSSITIRCGGCHHHDGLAQPYHTLKYAGHLGRCLPFLSVRATGCTLLCCRPRGSSAIRQVMRGSSKALGF